jgi:N-acetylmuramoyl-L-alanine amidase
MAYIAIDPGHGVNTPGKRTPQPVKRYGRVIKEYEANKLYATKLKAALERQGHKILWTGGDSDPALSTRTNKANAANVDYFISCHWNAGVGYKSTKGGTETYIYARGGQAEKLANAVQSQLVKAMGLGDRGVRVANLHVCRETKMPAILIEYGFMDTANDTDQQWMLDTEKAEAAAEAVAKGVQSFLGKSYKAPGGSTPAPAPSPAKWDGKSFPGKDAFKIGQSHPAVTVLGQRLVAHGFGSYYKVGPGPTFSEVDKEACAAFQKAQGWTGDDADGYPGPTTWERLMAEPMKKEEPMPQPKPEPQPEPKKEVFVVYINSNKVGQVDDIAEIQVKKELV